MSRLFFFFIVVALAAIGLIEWYKGLVSALKQPKGQRAQPVAISLLSLLACLVAGDIAVLGGLFKAFGLLGPAGGAFVGCIALGFVELAYQLVVQVFIEAVRALIRFLRGLSPSPTAVSGAVTVGGGGQGSTANATGGAEIAEASSGNEEASHPIGFSIRDEPESPGGAT